MNRRGAISGVALLVLFSATGCEDDSSPVSGPRYSETSYTSFGVANTVVLEVSNFAGDVNVTSGNPGEASVVARKWAGRREDLDDIEVRIIAANDTVRVDTDNPAMLDNASVDLVITVPPDTRPTLQVDAGNVDYIGPAQGECHFATGAGTITLRLPSDVNVEVQLSVGAGSIRVDFPVDGTVSGHAVDGIIGTGADGRIVAQVGAGKIGVVSQ